MHWFLNRRLVTKLTLVFLLLLVWMALVCLSGLFALRTVNQGVTDLGDHLVPALHAVSEMNIRASDYRGAEQQHVLAAGPSEKKKADKAMVDALAAFNQAQAHYESRMVSAEEATPWRDFQTGWQAYLADSKKVVEQSNNGFTEAAKDLLVDGSKVHFDAARGALLTLFDLNTQRVHQARQAGETVYERAVGTTTAALTISFALGMALALWLARTISRPLTRAVTIAQSVAAGDLQPLSTQHAVQADEIGQLLAALLAMQTQLGQVVAEVRDGADRMAHATAEIAHGNHDLSSRTEHQASALQETVSTMEALETTVQQNADAAKQANVLAQKASGMAALGGEVVGQVEDTMRGIHDSSRKIADIISVIDDIASQTNILALNAAVEAARAGEEGRGFAVVASEVRSLAGRSAEAAKEIKTLITDSVERVNTGSGLVHKAGTTMVEVVASIRQATDIMGAISQANATQSAHTAQIARAVGQMDQTTQQNAALVEQMAAAAGSLQRLAEELVQGVAVFKLGTAPVQDASPPPPSV